MSIRRTGSYEIDQCGAYPNLINLVHHPFTVISFGFGFSRHNGVVVRRPGSDHSQRRQDCGQRTEGCPSTEVGLQRRQDSVDRSEDGTDSNGPHPTGERQPNTDTAYVSQRQLDYGIKVNLC